MKSKSIKKYASLLTALLVVSLVFAMLDIYDFTARVKNMPLDVCVFDYFTRASSSIVAGINFYIFAVVLIVCAVFMIDEDYHYCILLKRGKRGMFVNQITKIFLMAGGFSLVFYAAVLIISWRIADVFYNWNDINGYLFYSHKYIIELNPYLLLLLIWLQIFSFALRVFLLYMNLKWIFFKKNEAVMAAVALITLTIEKLCGKTILYVSSGTIHSGLVYDMVLINGIIIILEIILLNVLIKKRDI